MNTFVFSSILAVILLANVLVSRYRDLSVTVLFGGLVGSLVLAFTVAIRALLVALPIFFAAMVFAVLFRDRPSGTAALAANVLGAIVAGVLEYSAMVVGFKMLYLIAALVYAAAYLCARRAVRVPVLAPAPA